MPRQSVNVQKEGQSLARKVTQPADKFKSILKAVWINLVESVPFLLACAVFLGVISLKSPLLVFCLLIGSLITIVMQQIGQQFNLPKPWLIICQISAVAIILSLFWLDYFAYPAQAQFFGKAESFSKTH